MSGKTTRRSLGQPRAGRSDWGQIERVAEIEAEAAADPDAAPIAGEECSRNATLVLPEPKRAVSLRIDSDVLRWFRDSGPGYQSRMNAVLRQYAAAHGAPVAGRSAREPRRKGD